MRRHRSRAALAAALTIALGGLAACEPPPPPTELTVVDDAGYGDAVPGDGVCEADEGVGNCTLLAAIQEGNATDGPVEITLAVPPGSTIDAATERPVVEGSTTIVGDGARIHGGFDHVAGDLVLRDVVIDAPSTSSCGSAVTSLGRSLHLDRVHIPYAIGTAVCSTGTLVLTRSEILGDGSAPGVVASGPVGVDRTTIGTGGGSIRLEGDGPFHAVSSVLFDLDTGDAPGRVLLSLVTGALTDRVEVGGSLILCEPGSEITSLGHNLDEEGRCGADAMGDQEVERLPFDILDITRGFPLTYTPAVGAPSVGAIPAGTPLLCDGSITVDQRDEPRDTGGPCDIGPNQTQVPVTLGGEEVRPLDIDRNIAVNAHGTVAATFPGDGTGASVGRWTADGVLTPSNDPQTRANDIADDGTVVGYKIVGGGVTLPWIWPADGPLQVIDGLPGATSGQVLLADDGTIVGRSTVDGTSKLWWRGTDGIVRPVVDGEGSTEVVALLDGHLFGARWDAHPTPTAWHLADGTSTAFSTAGLSDEPWPSATLLSRSPDGDVYGVVDDGVVVWHPDGSVGRLTQAFGGTSMAFVEGRPVIVTDLSCWGPCTLVLFGTGDTADARAVWGMEIRDVADDGTVVGVRDGDLVRAKLTIAP